MSYPPKSRTGSRQASRASRKPRSSRQGSRQASRQSTRPHKAEDFIEYAAAETISTEEAARLARTPAWQHPAECICTVCNCGAHHCPPDIVQGHYNNIKSEHQAQYTGEFVMPHRVNKQMYMHKPLRFEGTTTNQEDYKYYGNPKRRVPSETARGNNDVFTSNLPFDATTTAKHDYRRWDAAPAKPCNVIPKPTFTADSRNFQTEASSQYDYKRQRPRASCAPELSATASLPFEGRTLHQTDFPRHKGVSPARSFQRTRQWRPRGEDRFFDTEARAQYTEKDLDVCPAKPLSKTRKDYNGHVLVEPTMDGGYRLSQRPEQLPVVQGGYPAY